MAQRYLTFVCSILLALSLAACGDEDPSAPKSTDGGNNASDAGTDAADEDGGDTPTCGDGVVEGDEVCDGTDLDGETCSTQGATAGTLVCNDTCDGFDTTGCSTCGDGVVQGDEVCDGTELGGATCEVEGFDMGDISCTAECTLDTSECTFESCGNGTIDGNEDCDGANLDGATCSSQGADGGTLACAANCTFDTSACFACGDGVLNGDEECDGAELGGRTCSTEAFDGGTLGCTAACELDVSACYTCGDDIAEGPEACDGTDLNGNTCVTEGFAGGTLACDQTCALDTTQCDTCGDDTVNGADVCDGTDLAGQTCATLGFDGGTLACEATCGGFDESGCYTCGDDTIGGPEVCDGTALNSETCVSRGFDGGTLACATTCDGFDESACFACGNGVIDGPEQCDGALLAGETCITQGFDAGALACDTSCGFDSSGCIDYAAPQVGDFYITEFMFNPESISDSDGEWIEFFNNSTDTLALGDCEFRDSANTYDVPAGTNVAPGAYFTVASSATPGFTPDLDDLSFALNQGGDDIQVWCPDSTSTLVLIDSVAYDGGPNFPDTPGASVAFDTDLTGAVETLNDDGANWCEGRTAYGPGDFGTPGTANPGCAFCGNGIIDGAEVCDTTELNGETCVSQGFDRGTLGCATACDTYDTSQCENLSYPAVGEVVVNEVMVNPDAIDDTSGEYLELFSTSGSDLSLAGCEIRDDASSFTIPVGQVINSGAYFTLARSASAGFTADVTSLSVAFNNGGDSAQLWCPDGAGGQQMIDSVDFSQASFPTPTGASIQFDSDITNDATANDDGTNWCDTKISVYGAGDLGTPGAANESCATQTFTVDFCRLQFPSSINEEEGTVTTVYGRVYIAGLTDQSTGNDLSPSVVAQLGYGPDATNPDGSTDWTWEDAIPNPSWDGAAAGEANNDEYQLDFTTPPATGSPYDYAYRFSGDGGQSWLYCDLDGVTGDGTSGYDTAQAGDLVSTAPAVPTELYFSEYAEGTSNNKAVEIYNSSSADADLSTCEVRLYFNGASTAGRSIALSGTLAAGDVFTVCNSSLDTTLLPAGTSCDVNDSLTYNGDDAVELACADGPLDIIGQIGVDPGSAWSAGGVSTQNDTIRRACTVTAGDTDGSDAFDPSVEWTSAGVDDFSDFGSYTCP